MTDDRPIRTVKLPLWPGIDPATLTYRHPMTWVEASQFDRLLEAMRPGMVVEASVHETGKDES
jgi:hypothetical protein